LDNNYFIWFIPFLVPIQMSTKYTIVDKSIILTTTTLPTNNNFFKKTNISICVEFFQKKYIGVCKPQKQIKHAWSLRILKSCFIKPKSSQRISSIIVYPFFYLLGLKWLQSQLRYSKKNVTLQRTTIHKIEPWTMSFFHIIL
jgi:hypothetical protein